MHTKRAVVIGTGSGGLAATAFLAKAGCEVVALEQGSEVGGYLVPIVRPPYEFSVGLHYIGECRPNQTIHRMLTSLGIDPMELVTELDPDGFDRYRFPDMEVSFCRGLDNYRDRLAGLFPRSARELDRFFATIAKIREGFRAVVRLLLAQSDGLLETSFVARHPAMLRWSTSSYGTLLDWAFSDPRLKAILSAMSGNYGLPPSRASALHACIVLSHYGDGAFFPKGGGRTLRDALVAVAEARGATFRTKSRATKILVREGRAVGVEVAGDEVIPADLVVSAADPTVTFGKLLRAEHVPEHIAHKVDRTIPSIGTFCILLGIGSDLGRLGLGNHNVWSFPSWDVEAMYQPLFEGRVPENPFFFLAPNSLKDGAGALAPPDKTTVEILSFAPFDLFTGPKVKDVRGYLGVKERVRDDLLDAIDRRFPGMLSDLEVCETMSPIENSELVRAVRGSAYGPAVTPGQAGAFAFQVRTPLPNLFLAGSGVLGGGVAATMWSGMLAATIATGQRF